MARPAGWVVAGASVLALAAGLMDCGSSTCGIRVADAQSSDGGFLFPPSALRRSQLLSIPIQDSADFDETITSASIAGSDAPAFSVQTSFPMTLPAGTQGALQVTFTPDRVGQLSAEIVLQTVGMGPTPPIAVGGVGLSL